MAFLLSFMLEVTNPVSGVHGFEIKTEIEKNLVDQKTIKEKFILLLIVLTIFKEVIYIQEGVIFQD